MHCLFRSLGRIIKYSFKGKYCYNIPLLTRFKYVVLGYTPEDYVFYNLANNDYKEYLTEYEMKMTSNINKKFRFILDDKLIFEEIAGKYTRVPINYAYISGGNVYGLKDYSISNENIIEFIKEKKTCVLKLEAGSKGDGFFLIEYIGKNEFSINGDICRLDDVSKLIFEYKKDGILSEYIQQSEFSASLYPNSTNTIRIVCAKKKNERDFHIIAAAQRIGTDSSKPVDNISSGGLVCRIDLKTGELSCARRLHACDIEHCIKDYDKHPDTGEQLKGKIIPNWNKLKEDILALTYKFPYLNFVAWDVLLTDDGFCVIEGNNTSGLHILQVDKGLRFDELGDFYRSYGINGVNDIEIKKVKK